MNVFVKVYENLYKLDKLTKLASGWVFKPISVPAGLKRHDRWTQSRLSHDSLNLIGALMANTAHTDSRSLVNPQLNPHGFGRSQASPQTIRNRTTKQVSYMVNSKTSELQTK